MRRPIATRLGTTLACAALVLLGSAASASALAVSVGDSSFAPNSFTNQPSGFVQATSAGNAYTFPSAGTVSSFQTRAYDYTGTGGGVQAVIYRQAAGQSYTIVARSNSSAAGGNGSVTSGTFSPAASVQAGDLLGLETTSSTVLHTLATTAADSRAQYNAPFAAVGGNQAAAGPFSGYRVSVSVPFVAAGVTTCVLSAVRRAGSPGFAGGFDQGDVTVTASAGLQSISNVQVTNGAVTAPTFTPGTTAPVIVTTTKSTQGLITRFSFDATDTGAVTKHCA